ncbi:MAG: hypothetical protein E4H10_05030 [Bacteroidia bacterium]|nr:MAG: hypothetical protein E4H10_05030 [Bacteroidia bacterium]
MNKFFPAVLILFCLVFPAKGQEPDIDPMVLDSIYKLVDEDIFHADSLYIDKLYIDSLIADSLLNVLDYSHSPLKATLYALVLPGLGQAYNKKYWKMPIVWAGLGGVVYAVSFNTKKYQQATYDFAEDPSDQNQYALKYWRRYMELSYIGLVVVYAFQVLDAYVDAHLHNWNVNDNLSMGVAPSLQPLMHPSSLTGQSVGITCTLNIRGR